MPNLTLKSLKSCYKVAKEIGFKYSAVMFSNKQGIEIIINKMNEEKFEDFLYNKCGEILNDDLTHKIFSDMKIIGFTFANTFSDIESDFDFSVMELF